MIYHGYVVTHLDALCHLFTPGGRDGMYNGYPIALVTDAGAAKLGVEVMGVHGIVGRGVLLDIAALNGGPLPLGSIIRARRPRGGGGAAGRHRRHRRHPLHPQRRRRAATATSSAPASTPTACPGCTPARSRRSATTATATCIRRSPASRAGPSRST